MADNTNFFNSKVKPIMDKVYSDLRSKQNEEYAKELKSWHTLAANAADPYSMMGNDIAYNRVKALGQWNSKTTEDYISMVKAELQKKGITVDAVMEKQMVDYLVSKEIPKSSAEYILKKAAKGTLFALPYNARKSALEDHIEKDAERRYNPSLFEDATASILSWATTAATTMGLGGIWGQTATDLAVEGLNHAAGKEDEYLARQRAQAQKDYQTAEKKTASIPKWMLTQMGFDRIGNAKDADLTKALQWAESNAGNYRKKIQTAIENGERTVKAAGKDKDMSITDATLRAKQYEGFATAIQKEQNLRKDTGNHVVYQSAIAEAVEDAPLQTQAIEQPPAEQSTAQPQQTNCDQNGWNNLIGSIGLDGVGDTMNHLGFTLANLPDMLLGIFTGRTKSIGMNQSSLMPLAAIIAGTFIKNPLLKFPMMLWGGANLVNKMGQEALKDYRGSTNRQEHQQAATYKQYANELLDQRITSPVIEGDKLILNIDHVPRIVTLTPMILDAYEQGALPLNVIANRILAKSDAQRTVAVSQAQNASEQYEQRQEHEQSRGIR